MIDIALSAVTIILTGFIGALGAHVTLHPPAKSRKKRYTALFWTMTFAGIVVGIIQAKRNSDDIAAIKNNTSLPARFTVFAPQEIYPLIAGQKLSYSLDFRNGGPVETVGEGRAGGHAYISEILKDPKQQAELEEQFNEYLADPHSEYFHMAPVAPGGQGKITAEGPVLSREDFQSLESGKRVIYVLARLVDKDRYGQHVQNFCQLAQPPQNTVHGPDTLFHFCPFGIGN